VDVFDTDGRLLTPHHFVSNAPGAGPLENPWGIVHAPADFGPFSNDLLIGNVEGAGNINVFDPHTGRFLGQLKHPDGTPVAITGLWDLVFGGGQPINGRTNDLYFNAGFTAADPAGNGLFGVLRATGDGGQHHTPWDQGDDLDGAILPPDAGPATSDQQYSQPATQSVLAEQGTEASGWALPWVLPGTDLWDDLWTVPWSQRNRTTPTGAGSAYPEVLTDDEILVRAAGGYR
jgi:hypothetical protein